MSTFLKLTRVLCRTDIYFRLLRRVDRQGMVLRVDTRSRACLYAMSEQLISLFSVHDVALRIHAHLALKGLACIRMTSEKGIVRSLVYCARRLTQSNRKIGIFSRSPSYIHHY